MPRRSSIIGRLPRGEWVLRVVDGALIAVEATTGRTVKIDLPAPPPPTKDATHVQGKTIH